MERWNEICFVLSEKINSDITEKYFENNVIEALRILGWSEFHGDLIIRPSFNIGAANRITPDILAKSGSTNLFVIEIKQPIVPLKCRFTEQLTSYMRFLKLEFGMIIGEKIQLIYDGNLSENNKAFIFEEIEFDRNNPKGLEFIRLFSKDSFSKQTIENYVQKKLEEIENLKICESLKGELISLEYIPFLKDLMRSGLQSKYSDNVIEKVLTEIKIKISDNSASNQIEKLDNESNKFEEKPRKIRQLDYLKKEDLPIGKYVRVSFKEIVEVIDRNELEKLQKPDYSKETFDIQYPFLKKVTKSDNQKPVRYWKDPISILGESFFLCSEWYEQPANNDRPYYESWLKKMRNKL